MKLLDGKNPLTKHKFKFINFIYMFKIMKIILQKLQTMNHLQRRQCSLGHQNLCNTAMVERPVYEIEIMNVKFVPKKN